MDLYPLQPSNLSPQFCSAKYSCSKKKRKLKLKASTRTWTHVLFESHLGVLWLFHFFLSTHWHSLNEEINAFSSPPPRALHLTLTR